MLLTTTRQPGSAITVYRHPQSRLASEYGNTTYLEWCELEVARLNRGKAKARLDWSKGLVAVYRSDLSEEKAG